MAESRPRLSADNPTVLLGVVTIVSGVATGLFSDLRPPGQAIGLVAFAAWIVAIALVLWNPESRTRAGSGTRTAFFVSASAAFVLTAVLLVYAFVTGPRLSERTLVLTPSASQVIRAACPGAVGESGVAARIALNQLGDRFVHVELIEPGCDQADADIRIRSEDLLGVLPAR
jgi:hypothetical protein